MLSHFSHIWFFATPWTAAHQAPLSTGCSKQEYWSGLPFPPSRDSSGPKDWTHTFTSPALAGGLFTARATWVFFRKRECSVLYPKVHALTTWPPITWHFRPRSTWHPPATKGPHTWSWRPQAQSPGSWRTARAVHKVSAPAVAAVCKQLSGGGVAGHWAWLIWSWIKLYELSHFWLTLRTPHHETRA